METTQNNECTKIRKKLEQSAAIRELNDIKNKMGGVNLDSICNDELEITEKNLTDFNIKRLVQAVQCDLVYYDEQEISLLPKAVAIITMELAIRFLTDYIDGDIYFNTSYPTHNLDRAMTQITLAKDIYDNLDKLNQITAEICK